MQTLASFRPDTGTLLIESLCEAFADHAWNLDLRELLDEMKRNLREKDCEVIIKE
jgi:hypothetical protein